MQSENKRHTRLQKLSGSDFEIADGQPDIRGWKVKDESGKELGKVHELIFDYNDRKVRYVAVTIHEHDDSENRNVLVPIGIAELHPQDDDVILPLITEQQLSMLPKYDEDHFDTAHESTIRNVFGGLGNSESLNHDEFYGHEQFNDAKFYRNSSMTTKADEEDTSRSGTNANDLNSL